MQEAGGAERNNGGAGGGLKGANGVAAYSYLVHAPGGGTQSNGGAAGYSSHSGWGYAGTFGQGGSGIRGRDAGSGGGGGWYGGGGITYAGGGGGGSGYIGHPNLKNAKTYTMGSYHGISNGFIQITCIELLEFRKNTNFYQNVNDNIFNLEGIIME